MERGGAGAVRGGGDASFSRVCRCGRGDWRWRAGCAGPHGRGGPAPGTTRRCPRRRRGRLKGPGTGTSPDGASCLRCPGRGVGEQDAVLVLGECGAREVTVGLARDQAVDLVALVGPGRVPEPVLRVPYDQGWGSGTRPAYWMPRSCCSARSTSRQSAGFPGPRRLRQVSSRSGTPDGDGERPTCQYMVLAERKTSEVPPSLAASTVRRIGTDQYSSWPGKTRPR